MSETLPREVSLALCLPDGTPLGVTAPLTIPRGGWWSNARVLVDAARSAWGITPTILRIVSTGTRAGVERQLYAAEVTTPPAIALAPVDDSVFADEPLRMPWARPGGPSAHLEWAASTLAEIGMPLTADPVQLRTWNLSSMWRLPTAGGGAWLKAVPPFFAHEGAIIEALQAFAVPRLIARTDGMCLIGDVPGEDLYGADIPQAKRMIDLLVQMQLTATLDDLPAGIPDWSLGALAPAAEHTLRESAHELDSRERSAVARLIDRLDVIARDLAECGIPDTLVHGDFHPGNVRGSGDELTILDWGDSCTGHPLYDHAAFTDYIDVDVAAAATEHWLAVWRTAIPGSDPARALALLTPASALRQAALYRRFLDEIEPTEHVYHASDPGEWLRRAAERVG